MFIQELSIDGFKSYAQRVTVPHFDRFFNAITGLNGSGKSNILDSICFVLGITDLKQVRGLRSSFRGWRWLSGLVAKPDQPCCDKKLSRAAYL